MTRIRKVVWALAGLGLLAVLGARAEAAEPRAEVYQNGRILTAAGQVFDPGTLVVIDGKIAAVGPAEDVEVPEKARVHDVSGKVLIPGLVDSHSHVGVYSRPLVDANRDGNESTGPVQSIVRALDSLNPFDPGIRMALAGGITTANIMPGSANVIGGQTIYVKFRGHSPQQMWIASRDVLGGLKMANGENPKRTYGSRGVAPNTRMKVAALQRSEFIKAQEYLKKWERYRKELAAGKDVKAPDVDLSLEPLVEVLQKKRTVHFHSHRADDLLTTLRLQEEFGFELVIQHGTEAFKVLDEIAEAGVPVSMTIVDSPGGKAEVVDFTERCGAELAAAGIPVLINTDDPVTESRFFLRTAAVAVRGGLSPEKALQAITIEPARAMHLDHRLGSIEPGKDADFVILSGEPFSVYTRVLQTYIDGERVFDVKDPQDRMYQTGGFGWARSKAVPRVKFQAKPLPPAAIPATTETRTEGDGPLVVLAARLHTVSHGTILDGAVLIEQDTIRFVGPRKKLKVPANARVLVAQDVTPGLIDAYSVVPLNGQYNISADQDADETSDPNQADLRVLDAFNPGEPLLLYLMQQGVTVIHACPGRANVIGGMSGVFRTSGDSTKSMTIRYPFGMVFNLGESPKSTYENQRPGTRMGTAALLRNALAEAGNYRRARNDDDSNVDRDLKKEALVQVLQQDLVALFAAHRADDIQTALRLTEEFDLQSVLALATEGYRLVPALKEAGVPVIVHPTMQRVGAMETFHTFLGNAATLVDADVPVAMGSAFESYVPKTRVVRHEAAVAMVYGLGFQRALRTVTLEAARILGIDDQFGSLDVGKKADLVLYDGDPFEHTTHVERVLVNGEIVYDRSKQSQLPLSRWMFYLPSPPCCLY